MVLADSGWRDADARCKQQRARRRSTEPGCAPVWRAKSARPGANPVKTAATPSTTTPTTSSARTDRPKARATPPRAAIRRPTRIDSRGRATRMLKAPKPSMSTVSTIFAETLRPYAVWTSACHEPSSNHAWNVPVSATATTHASARFEKRATGYELREAGRWHLLVHRAERQAKCQLANEDRQVPLAKGHFPAHLRVADEGVRVHAKRDQ